MRIRSFDNDRSSEKRVIEVSEDGSTNGDTEAERVALRKVDRHILPLRSLFNMVSFLNK